VKILVANSVGRLSTGESLVLFPSRWDAAIPGRKDFAYYPYELAYLSSLLKVSCPEHDVKMVDGNLPRPDDVGFGWDSMQYAFNLVAEQPDVVITECSALSYKAMTNCCMEVKFQTGCKIILTGPFATYNPEQALKDGWDHVFPGEYEYQVLNHIVGSHDSATVPGKLVNIDTLPWPEDEDISRINYWERSNPLGNMPGMIQVFPTRGCPLSCTFCAVPLYYGGHGNTSRSHRTRNPAYVCAEINYLATKYEDRFYGCFFNEETHNADKEWFVKFCQELIKRNLDRYVYDAMCGYWNFDEDTVRLASDAGYQQLRVGVENLSERSGRAIKKNVNADRLLQFLHLCRDNGICAYGTFQVGAQGSSEEEDASTVAQIRAWETQGLMPRWQCSISTPQPGTPFYRDAATKGWLTTTNLMKYDGMHAVVDYPDYPAERIQQVFQSLWA